MDEYRSEASALLWMIEPIARIGDCFIFYYFSQTFGIICQQHWLQIITVKIEEFFGTLCSGISGTLSPGIGGTLSPGIGGTL